MAISSKIKKVISAIAVSASAMLYSCAPATAHAEFLSAEKWLFYARSPNELEKSIALGYVMGSHDAMNGVAYCTENVGFTAGQLFEVVRNALENNAELRKYTADSVITEFLKTAFPCTKQKNRTSA